MKKLFCSGKGQVEIQFNWVFILIAGAVILTFFVGVATWYKNTKEKELAFEVLNKIETVIAGASQGTDTSNRIPVPYMEMVFDCDPSPEACGPGGCSSSFRFEGAGSKDISIYPVFSPRMMKSEMLHLWAIDSKIPFKVTNYLYVTNPSLRYVLVYKEGDAVSEDYARHIHEMMSRHNITDLDIIPSSGFSDIKYDNEYLLRFVFFYEPTGSSLTNEHLANDKRARWDVIYISPPQSGAAPSVKYAKLEDQDDKVVYVPDADTMMRAVDDPGVIGAIFSEDHDNYVCNMKKVWLKSGIIASMYKERTRILKSEIVSSDCQSIYDVDSYFSNIEAALKRSFDNSELSSDDYDNIQAAINALEDANEYSIYKSCPRIY